MPGIFDYTKYSRKFVNRFPVMNYLFQQIIFWLFAYAFLAVLVHLTLRTAGPVLQAKLSLAANLTIALFMGFFSGLASGLSDLLFEKRLFHNKALVIIFLGKAIINFIIFVFLVSFVRYTIYPSVLSRFFNNADIKGSEQSWEAFFQLLLVYNIVSGLLISFINQVNKKFGPGVLLPIFLGKYRKPKEEERIFLFMDLKSSTTIAETLGHLKYSSFIRDSFMDINAVLSTYNAQIYQYVGDEIIITWPVAEGLKHLFCIEFFFACESRFGKRHDYYFQKYGHSPQFKAGLHIGKVIAVEVGEIKRDIAYLGDTMNTTARIQSVCNEYNKTLLASVEVLRISNAGKYYDIESLGMISLKGKSKAVEIAGVSRQQNGIPLVPRL